MLELMNSTTWLIVFTASSAGLGVLLSWYWPGTVLRARVHRWRGRSAFGIGSVLGLLAAAGVERLLTWLGFSDLPVVIGVTRTIVGVIMAIAVAYFWSRRPEGPPQFFITLLDRLASDGEKKVEVKTADAPVERMVFRSEWNARPRFETGEEGLFVGRNELLGRLSSHFISKSGGTILISGVRGVGKTALVDRALVHAREELADRYWEQLALHLRKRAKLWRPITFTVWRNLRRLREHPTPGTESPKSTTLTGEQLRRGAEAYLEHPRRRFWRRFNVIGKRISRMREASTTQLFVLKFSTSDIAGALAEPDQKATGKPRMDPEKLLRSVIRKLHATCHPSGPNERAKVLQWSLCNKKLRRIFFDDLQKAYDKSISKSYKEIISNSINDFVKQQWTIESQSKLNPVRLIIAAVVFLGVFWGGYQLLPKLTFLTAGFDENWKKLTSGTISTIAGALASYFSWSLTANWSR